MKKYYHLTSLNKIRSISSVGLIPDYEDSNKLINSAENKISFSEGMSGVVAQYANYQKHYDLIKSGVVVENVAQETVEKVKTTPNMQEYLGEKVYISFNGENIENENNFMNGTTDKPIDSEDINVCLLRNNETGEVSYSSSNIVHYMMAKISVEAISYAGADTSEENTKKKTEAIRKDVLSYIKDHENEINSYKQGDYTIESVPIRTFCTQYLFQKGDNVSGQSLGKATMDLLKNVEAVREMEAQLDKDVREITLGRDSAEPDHTLIPKERAERNKDTNQ